MDPIFAEVLEFRDRRRVVKTLQLIEGHSRSLILSEPTADWTLAIDRLWVDDDEKALVLEAAATDCAGIDLAARACAALDGIAPVTARVVDLWIGGCQIELPVAAALTLEVNGAPLEMAILFPNGDRFEAAAVARYARLLGTTGLARAAILRADR